ncbi:MAG: hypothetical protein J0L92_12765 [Deltaproteobacteria bacterium]|nr:hypothetical protein [Deltaproteobacteria bacterium]
MSIDRGGWALAAAWLWISGCGGAEGDCGVGPVQLVTQPCCPSYGVDACVDGAFCAAFDGRTIAPCLGEGSRLDGETCFADNHCASMSCNTTAGACRTILSLTCDRAIGCAPISGMPRACTQNDDGVFECTAVGSGGVASPCGADTDCAAGLGCDPTGRCVVTGMIEPVEPRDELDLLILVDNSNSMSEEQVILVQELPFLVEALATGDTDRDGVPDVQPVRSLHVGVVTPDMGAGPNSGIPTCARGLGDDGVMRARSRLTSTPCMATYPSNVFEFEPAGGSASLFGATIGCAANIGTGGCGFEQQLEASLKAVTPVNAESWTGAGYVPPLFLNGDGDVDALAGHADRDNAGFLRSSSILAVLLVTDEEDCSVSDYGLFVSTDSRFAGVPLNLRCSEFSDPEDGVVYPISRYVDGFVGLRARPEHLVFAAIAGIPPEVEPPLGVAIPDFDRILAHPDMAVRPNPEGTNLLPSCSTTNGVAYPPIRIVRVAQGLADRGAGVSLSSICSEDFQTPMRSLLAQLGARLPPL